MRDSPRSWIELARWVGTYGDDPDRLLLILLSAHIAEAHPREIVSMVAEWYPETEIELHPDERLNNHSNADVGPKALFLTAVVTNLAKHAGVPAAAINDHIKLLSKYRLRGSRQRAHAQAVLLSNHKASKREVARESGMSESNVGKDLRSGMLKRPTYDLKLDLGSLVCMV